MSKIKDEKTARELFGKMTSFGLVPDELSKEESGLSRQDLINSVEDEETKTLLQERKSSQKSGRRGRPKNEDSEQWQKMTFIVNREQLSELREIAHNERKMTKELLFEALERYIQNYKSGKLGGE